MTQHTAPITSAGNACQSAAGMDLQHKAAAYAHVHLGELSSELLTATAQGRGPTGCMQELARLWREIGCSTTIAMNAAVKLVHQTALERALIADFLRGDGAGGDHLAAPTVAMVARRVHRASVDAPIPAATLALVRVMIAAAARAAGIELPMAAAAGGTTEEVRGRRMVIGAGALGLVMNALERDAQQGKTSRAEILAVLRASVTPYTPA